MSSNHTLGTEKERQISSEVTRHAFGFACRQALKVHGANATPLITRMRLILSSSEVVNLSTLFLVTADKLKSIPDLLPSLVKIFPEECEKVIFHNPNKYKFLAEVYVKVHRESSDKARQVRNIERAACIKTHEPIDPTIPTERFPRHEEQSVATLTALCEVV